MLLNLCHLKNIYVLMSCASLSLHERLLIGTCRWGEFGEGGRLWGECNSRHFEWLDGNPLTNLLSKVCIASASATLLFLSKA